MFHGFIGLLRFRRYKLQNMQYNVFTWFNIFNSEEGVIAIQQVNGWVKLNGQDLVGSIKGYINMYRFLTGML